MSTADYSEYLNSDKWKLVRRQAIERAGYHCQVCNSPDGLDAHHRTYERLGNELPEDITVLCDNCHTLFHESRSSASIASLVEALNDTYTRIDERMGRKDPNAVSGIATGFVDLDQLTAGLQDSELIVIAARPGVGKTGFALNIARHVVVEQKLPILFSSLDQTRIELCERLLSAQGRVDGHKLRTGHLSKDDIQRLHVAGEVLRNAQLYSNDSPYQHLPHIVATLGKLVRERGVRLAIIDSIDLIEPPSGNRNFRPEQIATIARRLKRLARELKLPLVVIANLTRMAEDRQDHRPRLADLGALEQYADVCLFLHRPGRFEELTKDNKVEVIVAKQRNGPVGDLTLFYRKEYQLFENYDPKFDDDFKT